MTSNDNMPIIVGVGDVRETLTETLLRIGLIHLVAVITHQPVLLSDSV